MTDNIAAKTIVITGASSGMGAAARLLAAKGANVVLGARRADRIDALAAEIIDAGGKATSVTTDVTSKMTCGRWWTLAWKSTDGSTCSSIMRASCHSLRW